MSASSGGGGGNNDKGSSNTAREFVDQAAREHVDPERDHDAPDVEAPQHAPVGNSVQAAAATAAREGTPTAIAAPITAARVARLLGKPVAPPPPPVAHTRGDEGGPPPPPPPTDKSDEPADE